jgi:hypothetical protein
MEKIKKYFQVKSIRGEPVYSDDSIVTPISQVFSIKVPYLNLVWNRPHEVHVENGQTESTIQIVNVTRLSQIAIYGFGAMTMLILLLFGRKTTS